MNITTITCTHCNKTFKLSEAISHQINDELFKAKMEQSDMLRKEFDAIAEKQTQQAVEDALAKARQATKVKLAQEQKNARIELEKKDIEVAQTKQDMAFEVERAKQATEFEMDRLRKLAENSKESEKELRKQMSALIDELSKANKAKEDAELAARQDLLEKEKIIREEATEKASENYNLKIREQEELISKLKEQLTTAKQVAEQGSQQLQGEVLELDVEQNLRTSFPYDIINEVKKGERGSDIRQMVNEQFHQNCGLILWECKNTKTYQAGWVNKLKDEMAAEKAQIGVIVFNQTGGNTKDFEQLSDSIWLVKPQRVIMLATLLREILLKVHIANRNAEGKDVKVELMYNYLTSAEFKNRVSYIVESYSDLTAQLDLEKKQAQKRWALQEKVIQKAISSITGMSGDLEGITGREIISLPEL
ncbi:MAG: DUF2130 domain-containing protein [Defluviitaleaceae bacterium]|nr:DUF2130 domain-containing protein [Defluviitaleaceae bacterium]